VRSVALASNNTGVAEDATQDALARALQRLLLGYGIADTAELLATSEGNVKNALFRARTALATTLRIDEGVADGEG
jgi:hypothetical protein